MRKVTLPPPLWATGKGRLLRPAPFLVAGIVNVTPDSFSDGGQFNTPERAVELMRRHIAEGAELIDIGAESTRPGAEDIGADEELRRLKPVLELARANGLLETPSATFCLDTFRPKTAAWALENGISVINDISGTLFEPGMVSVLADYKPGYILGHSPARPALMQEKNHYPNVVNAVLQHFTDTMDALVRAGLPEENICLDPCIGFGKSTTQSLELFAAVPRLLALGRPLYFGISRKRFLTDITGFSLEERACPTQVVTALLANKGVHIHRVHDVAATKGTLAIVQAMQQRN